MCAVLAALSYGSCCVPFLGLFALLFVAVFAVPGALFGWVGMKNNPTDSTDRGIALSGLALNGVHLVLLAVFGLVQISFFVLVGLGMALES